MADTQVLSFTKKSKLREQLESLYIERKKVAEEIKIARSFGDLSDNTEYTAAKAKEAEVYDKIARIENELRTTTFVDENLLSTDTAALGTVVRVLDLAYDEEDEYTLVDSDEADPAKLFITTESPIGIALCNTDGKGTGARVGDVVEANISGDILRLKVMFIRKRADRKGGKKARKKARKSYMTTPELPGILRLI